MPLARVNGIHLFYDEAGVGRPVIFVHAYPMGRRMWAPQVAHFQARYRVIVYDCRGFGDSEAPPTPDGYSQAQSVEDLRGLCQALHIQHSIFAGYAARGPAEAAAMREMVAAHPAHGVAHTARETLAKRPPIFSLEAKLRALQVPALIVVGEQDLPCLAPSEFMARTIPRAELTVMAGCGHFNNLERPVEFNRVVEAFFRKVGWEA